MKGIWIARISVVLTIIIFAIVIMKLRACKSDDVQPTSTIYIHDTTVVERYKESVKKDTVIRWFEKIIYKKSEPEKVYYTKTDSLFIREVEKLDVMLSVEKKSRGLFIYAFNERDTLAKQYVFTDVGREFTVIAQSGKLFVKSKKFYWDGVSFLAGANVAPDGISKLKNYNPTVGLRTGISYLDKFGIEFGTNYEFKSNQLSLTMNLKFNILH